ncbi:hypothetical protein CJ205_04350 [Dolosicoccus paucivorans]|uniref:Flavodoxin-like fold domain-containing protein n=1 Tax=Dolosicoccus paucivorans TaxID=84521 RepID=A0A2N6SMX9_9LACT|nr:NAD(P)H-dependent oxidoreductase [Dolosicoccus paucivorans]PMB84177.1 hypothetical protein CJ206_05280 [Dolosicoccus paucivorans]PMC58427.1 hypothetical protein CJ205_04350 [Dolosicoccus paucivorans]
MQTLVVVGHDKIDRSSSHQFFISAGQEMEQVDYLLLDRWLKKSEPLWKQREHLLTYDRIIFQFQLHWYQAPYVMKEWIDYIFQLDDDFSNFKKALRQKELGLVVIAGSPKNQYQPGGSQGRSIYDLLAPYELLARHFEMVYLPAFVVHEFHLLGQQKQQQLLWRYNSYVTTGNQGRFSKYQRFIIHQLDSLAPEQFDASPEDLVLLDMLIETMTDRADDLEQLKGLVEEW